ncbi:MAG: tetratricopeptide repeat protein [Flavobacteriales bacterium]|nr:tetratricopeptide repeat protein [Flavobacteriales bacterium]
MLLFISVFGKANSIDSLFEITGNKNSSYKEKQTAFKSLFDTYKKNNADSAHFIADKIFQLAQPQNNLIDFSNALLYHGITYENFSELDSAIMSYHKSLTYARKSRNNNQVTKVLINLGGTYKDIGNPSKALEYLNECVKLLLKIITRKMCKSL